MVAQVTLTPNEGKRLIAEAVATLPELLQALKNGKVLFKGGTTVSVLTEKLLGISLRISGRISARGALTSVEADMSTPHTLLVDKGVPRNVDQEILSAVRSLGPGDIAILGANALDRFGYTATMAGTVGGGPPGEGWTSLMTEGADVWILVGWDKLIPTTIAEAVAAAGRKKASVALGMSVGLMPLLGKVYTETEAFGILGKVRATVIGKGGTLGGEGATVYSLEGEEEEVMRLFHLVEQIKGVGVSGVTDSLKECTGPNPRCATHEGCVYGKRVPHRRYT
ncbi:MAG: hypothetical protein N2442_11640 [Spirochaetes bacterium]|nr:hypothetical protein [Spirochaetota bacterium]